MLPKLLVMAGQGRPGDMRDPPGLAMARRRERRHAVGRIPERHDWLGYPGDDLDQIGVAPLRTIIAAFLRDERPDVHPTLVSRSVARHRVGTPVGAAG